jgi:hypothetical protein
MIKNKLKKNPIALCKTNQNFTGRIFNTAFVFGDVLECPAVLCPTLDSIKD